MNEKLTSAEIVAPRPTDSVRVVLYDADDSEGVRVIAVEEEDDLGNFKFVGGKFERVINEDGTEGDWETPDEAVAREIPEEIGVAAEEVKLRKLGEYPNNDGVSARHIYSGSVSYSKIQKGKGINEVISVEPGELPQGKHVKHMLGAFAVSKDNPDAPLVVFDIDKTT